MLNSPILRGDDLRHLLRRLTFAATPDLEDALVDLPADAATARLVAVSRTLPQPTPPACVSGTWTNRALRVRGTSAARYDAMRAAQLGSDRRDTELVRQWWLQELIAGHAPLRENLTLFFQTTLGCSASTVEIPHALHQSNALVRRMCLGSIPALLEALVLDPAMMVQIGMDEHRKVRVSDRPAKLILDYWTVGAGHYADADVEGLSRALTGWSLRATDGREPVQPVDADADRVARRTGLTPTFDPAEFDARDKTILGSTRNYSARAAVRTLARHPATARRFSRELVRYFGVEDPHQRLEGALAATYRGTGGSMQALLRGIVRSPEFWSADSRWSLIKSPVHLAVGACRQLEVLTPPLEHISRWLSAAGQTLFDTPNAGEGGWPGREAWVTPPDRLAIRYQLSRVLSGQPPQLGIHRRTATAVTSPAAVPVGAALANASADALVARLDLAPGFNRSAIGRDELIHRVTATPQYQLA